MNKPQFKQDETDQHKNPPKDEVEEASEESFPASDPPSFNPGVGVGAKDEKQENHHRYEEGKWWKTGSVGS